MRWFFEPGHTAAEFRARHMMVTWVRGHFKPVEGVLEFDPGEPEKARCEVKIDAANLWTGVPERDEHLRSADFLDVAHHPTLTFVSNKVELVGENEFRVTGLLTLRGVTREVELDVRYLGTWKTPYWVAGESKRTFLRAGFVANTKINRHDFGVSWNDTLDRGGIVVSDDVYLTLVVEALHELTGAERPAPPGETAAPAAPG